MIYLPANNNLCMSMVGLPVLDGTSRTTGGTKFGRFFVAPGGLVFTTSCFPVTIPKYPKAEPSGPLVCNRRCRPLRQAASLLRIRGSASAHVDEGRFSGRVWIGRRSADSSG